MYKIELINKKTKEVFNYEYLNDFNFGEKLYFKFEIDTTQLADGEYHLHLYDENDELIVTDTLSINNFNLNGIQYEKGENIYIENVIDAKTQTKQVEIKDVVTTVYPDDGYNVMTQVTVDAQQVYDNGYTQGKEQGKQDGIEEQKSKLSSITIEVNGTYTNEDGYDEVIVNVLPPQHSQPQTEVLLKTITKNGQYDYKPENADYFREANITVNVLPKLQQKQVTVTDTNTTVTPDSDIDGFSQVSINALPVYNNAYNVGKSDGVEEQKEKLSTISITENGTYTNEDGYNEVIVDVKTGGAFDFNVIGYDDEQTNEANQQINNDIAYSKSVLSKWRAGAYADLRNMYQLVYCPQIDTSKQKNFSGFFKNCNSLKKISKLSTVNSNNSYVEMFAECYSLKKLNNAELDTSNGTNFEKFCYNCSNLTEFNLDISKGTNFKSTFSGCKSLQSFNLDVSQGTNYESMFSKSLNLKTVSNFNTSNASTLKYCFSECENLISVNDLNIPVATDLSYIFNSCKSLVTPPKFLNCVATNCESIFSACSNLESVELFNTENVTSFSYMFNNCSKLMTIPNFSTSKVSNFGHFLYQAISLERLPLINMSSATNISYFFGYQKLEKLTDLGGFKNLKINWNDNYGLTSCPNLTKQSVLNVLNNLYDFRGNGDSTTTRTIKFHKNSLALLTDDEKAIATAKGWVLTN